MQNSMGVGKAKVWVGVQGLKKPFWSSGSWKKKKEIFFLLLTTSEHKNKLRQLNVERLHLID